MNVFRLIFILIIVPGSVIRAQKAPEHYVFFNIERDRIREELFLDTRGFEGAQLKYTWKELEPAKDRYDFSDIQNDVNFLRKRGKRLFIQVQDVSFDTAIVNIPQYLIEQPLYNGGMAPQYETDDKDRIIRQDGYVARRWDPLVALRFYKLLKELGKQFDGKIEGICLPETSVGFGETGSLYPNGFTPEIYRDAIKNQMNAARHSFERSTVIQYANFMPGEWLPWKNKGYLESLYRFAGENNIGMGGPDIKIYKKAQMDHSYRFLKQYTHDIRIGMAVQWGNYEEINPKTGKRVTVSEIVEFGNVEIGADYIFWCTQEPYYSGELIPYIRNR